jgi:hypothetical protein
VEFALFFASNSLAVNSPERIHFNSFTAFWPIWAEGASWHGVAGQRPLK